MTKLPKKPCTLAGHINARTQKNGDEHVPFMDLKLSMLLTAKQTATLTGESHIAEAWFKTEGGELSDPLLKDWAPYRMKCKFKDSLCVLIVGVNAKEIDLGNCTIKGCTFEPVDRGSTQLTCTVQRRSPAKPTKHFCGWAMRSTPSCNSAKWSSMKLRKSWTLKVSVRMTTMRQLEVRRRTMIHLRRQR